MHTCIAVSSSASAGFSSLTLKSIAFVAQSIAVFLQLPR
jgi:hypothetical protein